MKQEKGRLKKRERHRRGKVNDRGLFSWHLFIQLEASSSSPAVPEGKVRRAAIGKTPTSRPRCVVLRLFPSVPAGSSGVGPTAPLAPVRILAQPVPLAIVRSLNRHVAVPSGVAPPVTVTRVPVTRAPILAKTAAVGRRGTAQSIASSIGW